MTGKGSMTTLHPWRLWAGRLLLGLRRVPAGCRVELEDDTITVWDQPNQYDARWIRFMRRGA